MIKENDLLWHFNIVKAIEALFMKTISYDLDGHFFVYSNAVVYAFWVLL